MCSILSFSFPTIISSLNLFLYQLIVVAQLVKNPPTKQVTAVWFLGLEDPPWRRERLPTPVFWGFPGGSDSKESACNVGDLDLSPGLGRSSGEGNGYPLQYSGLEKSTDGGAWQATVHEVAESQTWLSNFYLLTHPYLTILPSFLDSNNHVRLVLIQTNSRLINYSTTKKLFYRFILTIKYQILQNN